MKNRYSADIMNLQFVLYCFLQILKIWMEVERVLTCVTFVTCFRLFFFSYNIFEGKTTVVSLLSVYSDIEFVRAIFINGSTISNFVKKKRKELFTRNRWLHRRLKTITEHSKHEVIRHVIKRQLTIYQGKFTTKN